MTYKTRFKELEKILKNIITLDDEIITNHLEELENSGFYQRLLDEKIFYKRVLDIMQISEESDTIEDFYDTLADLSYISEGSD